jgi:hypothetical protein
MRICKKIGFLYANHKAGGRDKRNSLRYFRRDAIKCNKLAILRDVRSGHNIGDFELDPDDLVSALTYSDKTSMKVLTTLHKKYRG